MAKKSIFNFQKLPFSRYLPVPAAWLQFGHPPGVPAPRGGGDLRGTEEGKQKLDRLRLINPGLVVTPTGALTPAKPSSGPGPGAAPDASDGQPAPQYRFRPFACRTPQKVLGLVQRFWMQKDRGIG